MTTTSCSCVTATEGRSGRSGGAARALWWGPCGVWPWLGAVPLVSGGDFAVELKNGLDEPELGNRVVPDSERPTWVVNPGGRRAADALSWVVEPLQARRPVALGHPNPLPEAGVSMRDSGRSNMITLLKRPSCESSSAGLGNLHIALTLPFPKAGRLGGIFSHPESLRGLAQGPGGFCCCRSSLAQPYPLIPAYRGGEIAVCPTCRNYSEG